MALNDLCVSMYLSALSHSFIFVSSDLNLFLWIYICFFGFIFVSMYLFSSRSAVDEEEYQSPESEGEESSQAVKPAADQPLTDNKAKGNTNANANTNTSFIAL